MNLLSKNAVEKYLILLWVLQCVSPHPPSGRGGHKGAVKDVAAGIVTCCNVCAYGLIICMIASATDKFEAPYHLDLPWSKADLFFMAVSVFGAWLRIMAGLGLSHQFTWGQLGIIQDHQLVQTGLYRCLRHPAYTGSVLGLFGFLGFLGLHPPGQVWTLIFALPVTAFLAVRIPHEERILHQHFGRQWEEYCSRTWRLLPLIF